MKNLVSHKRQIFPLFSLVAGLVPLPFTMVAILVDLAPNTLWLLTDLKKDCWLLDLFYH